jgi:4-hydroxy-tetrahydrodipicolinate synthase
MPAMRFHGSITALITPFADGKIDEKRFQDFAAWQISQGTHGLVPCGTTGECPTLSDDEQRCVIQLCVETAKDKVPVIAGCGSNNTAHAVRLTQQAEKLGADAALHVTPYYNKPTQEGLYQHYKAIHDASGLPIFIYNIPGRSAVNMSVETMARLAQLPRIAGTKDSAGDITRPPRVRALCKPEFCQLTGDDPVALPFLAEGGHGCISVTSNVAPALCAQLQNAWAKGDITAAQEINARLLPLHDAMFCETSPGPVKYAASLLGMCRYEFRLPMVPIAKAHEKLVEDAMRKAGLLSADVMPAKWA